MSRSLVGERMEIYAYFAQMGAVYPLLSEEEKADLERWDSEKVDGSGAYGTSDWPGWTEYIGKRPEYPPVPEYRKEPIPAAIRWEVWERDNFTCQVCGTRRQLSVDHIIPESKGGALDLDNLQTLCTVCNSRKGDRLPDNHRSTDSIQYMAQQEKANDHAK